MLVTIPFALLVLDYWPLSRFAASARTMATLVTEKVPLVFLASGSAIATMLAQHGGIDVMGSPLGLRLETAIVTYVTYLRQFSSPTDLALLYPHPEDRGSRALRFALQLCGIA